MADKQNWEEKYKQVKLRYDQLCNVRFTAVESDIIDLKKKIQEHYDAQMASVNEIIAENKSLKKEIKEIKSAQDGINYLKQIVEDQKSQLRIIDTILLTVLDYRFLNVRCVGPSHYRLNCVNNDNIVFELYKGQRAIIYRPIKIPNSQIFIRFQNEVQVPDLKIFCDDLQNTIYQ